MAIPAYLWLKDDGGALIKGAVDVKGRESSIEVNGFSHNVSIPTDPLTGKITGARKHSSIIFLIPRLPIYLRPLVQAKN